MGYKGIHGSAMDAEMHTPDADVAWPKLRQSAYGPVGVRSEPDCDPLRLRRMGAARMLWLMRSLPVSYSKLRWALGRFLSCPPSLVTRLWVAAA